jgi:hypothetical protein
MITTSITTILKMAIILPFKGRPAFTSHIRTTAIINTEIKMNKNIQ